MNYLIINSESANEAALETWSRKQKLITSNEYFICRLGSLSLVYIHILFLDVHSGS